MSSFKSWLQESEYSAVDGFQDILRVVGIFDPTPIADGANTVISLIRRKYGQAALDALGMIPYGGDLAKIPRVGAIFQKLKLAASQSPKTAHALQQVIAAAKGYKDMAGGQAVGRLASFIPADIHATS